MEQVNQEQKENNVQKPERRLGKCIECGGIVSLSAAFCPHCGFVYKVAPFPRITNQVKNGALSKTFFTLGALALTFSIIFLVICFVGKSIYAVIPAAGVLSGLFLLAIGKVIEILEDIRGRFYKE